MARAQYSDMALAVDSLGALSVYPEVRVHVFERGTTDLAAIYTTEVGNNPLANPFVTSNAKVEFWADAGAYDLRIEDTVAPVRFAPRNLSWDAAPAISGGFPTDFLARDGGMLISMLAAEVQRQLHPIGEVIEWWRPTASEPLPAGFVPLDGRTLQDVDHDFAVAGAVTLPDMRNKFTLGADHTKADGAAAGAGDSAASAPGIGAVGGSNSKNLSHVHSMQGHTHDISHTHTVQSPISVVAGVLAVLDPRGNAHQVGEGGGGINTTSHAYTGDAFASAAGERYTFSTNGASTSSSGGPSVGNTGSGLSSSEDIRPRWVGLLKLIKAQRA